MVELQEDCIEHLKTHVTDENAAEVWAAADVCDNSLLKEAVFQHLYDIRGKSDISEIPGLEELLSPQSQELLSYWQSRISASETKFNEDFTDLSNRFAQLETDHSELRDKYKETKEKLSSANKKMQKLEPILRAQCNRPLC